MKIFSSLVILLASAVLVTGCAEKESENTGDLITRSFELWMGKYYPEAEKTESGLYYEWLGRSGSGLKPETDDWIMLNYVGRDIDGNVFSNRFADIAVYEKTFTLHTHYSPHYMKYQADMILTPGEIEALGFMEKGDRVRLYIPPKLGYAGANYQISFGYGYEGWINTSSANNPNTISSVSGRTVIIDLYLEDIIEDAEYYEGSQVEDRRVEIGSMTAADEGLYFKYTNENTSAPRIGEDSTFYITYTGRFLDGFLFKTNDPVIAVDEWDDVNSTFSPIAYKASSVSLSLPETAISQLIKQVTVRYDSELMVLFTSDWGYGLAGSTATTTNPVVYPYTPLIFYIQTYPYGYDPDAEE